MFRLLASASALLVLFASAKSSAQAEPVKVPAEFTDVYAPGGFDSNDHVQILGEGMFRNTCYRHAATNVRVDEAKRQILLGPVAYEYSGFCLQVVLPFNRVIDVGILKPGTWDIVQGTTLEKLGQITIRSAAHEAADDYVYAPISQAFFQQKGSISEVLLTGEFSNSCLSLDQVTVTLEPDVIVIQPTAKVEERPDCMANTISFSKLVTLPTLQPGKYLLHVRSMNGNAVNSLVTVK